MKKAALVFLSIFIFSACGVKLDPASMMITPADTEMITVPQGCEGVYDGRLFTVAVTEFANLTTYGNANVTQGTSSTTGVGATAGVTDGRHFAAISAGQSFTSYQSVSKYMEPQLGEFAQGAVESSLVALGGVNVVTRSQMNSILKEQQFQMTLADPNTAVEFGLLSGAEYIITGSVDNIKVSYTSPMDLKNSTTDSTVSMILALSSSIYNAVAAGWNIETEMTVNIIDVASGKIIDSKRSTGTANIGDTPGFTVDQVIAGAKAAMSKTVRESMIMFAQKFEVKGYINEMRGNKEAALISIGYIQGLKEGDRLVPQEILVQKDFRTNEQKCSLTSLNFDLTVSNQVSENHAWAKVNTTDPAKLSRIKIGSIVIRKVK